MLLGGGGESAHNCYTRKQRGEIFTHYPELHLAQEVTYKTISASGSGGNLQDYFCIWLRR